MITHFLQFTDEATAKAQLPSYWSANEDGTWDWHRDCVDGPIPITQPTGTFTTDPDTGAQVPVLERTPGYFLNLALPALDTTLPGLTGAGYRDAITKAWVTVYGTAPAAAPQREFAT